MKIKSLVLAAAFLATATFLRAATNDLSGALQKGLFEEEANRNLDAAIQAYQSVATQFDKDRQLAATAIFRLGECYRKLGKTNEAVAQYERIVREFADQDTLVTLSRQNLVGLGQVSTQSLNGPDSGLAGARTGTVAELEKELFLLTAQIEQGRKETNLWVVATLFDDWRLRDALNALSSMQRELTWNRAKTNNQENIANIRTLETNVKSLEEGVATFAQRLFDSKEARLNVLQSALQQARVDRPTQSAAADASANALAQGSATALQAQIEELKSLGPEMRRIAIQQNFPTPYLTSLMQDLSRAEQNLVSVRNDFGPDNPEVKKATAVLDTINKQIDTHLEGVLLGLEIKMKAALQVVESKRAPKEIAASAGLGKATGGDEEYDEMVRIQAMIKSSPDLINAKDAQAGATPLLNAVSRGQLRVAKFLLANGADIEAKDRAWGGRTPLHYAVSAGNKAMVDLLLGNKADVRAVDKNGNTPLHLATLTGNRSVVEALLAHGADVNAKTKEGGTALHMAAAIGFKSI